MLTGSAETPRVTDMRMSNRRPPMRIANATQRGLKHVCYSGKTDISLKLLK